MRTADGPGIVRLLACEAGQSLVEFALVLPLMSFTILGGAEMSRAFQVQLAVINAARVAAEQVALDYTPTSTEATTAAQDELSRTPGITSTSATVTLTFTQSDLATKCTGAADTSSAGTPSIATPCYANVRVQYTYSTLVPWPGLPRTFAFDRTAHVRRYF